MAARKVRIRILAPYITTGLGIPDEEEVEVEESVARQAIEAGAPRKSARSARGPASKRK